MPNMSTVTRLVTAKIKKLGPKNWIQRRDNKRMWNILAPSGLCGTQKGLVGRKYAATKLVAVLIFAVFCTRHPETGAPGLPVGELRAAWGHEWAAPTCEICARDANNVPNLKL